MLFPVTVHLWSATVQTCREMESSRNKDEAQDTDQDKRQGRNAGVQILSVVAMIGLCSSKILASTSCIHTLPAVKCFNSRWPCAYEFQCHGVAPDFKRGQQHTHQTDRQPPGKHSGSVTMGKSLLFPAVPRLLPPLEGSTKPGLILVPHEGIA